MRRQACYISNHHLATHYVQIFSKETEHFAGETLLAKQEIVKSLAELVRKGNASYRDSKRAKCTKVNCQISVYIAFKNIQHKITQAHYRMQVEQWTDMAMKMFCRHQIDSKAEEFEMMRKTNANIDQLLAEYSVRVSGENGIATSFLHLLTPMETWYVVCLLIRCLAF